MADPVLKLNGIERDFGEGELLTTVLKDVALEVNRGEVVAIIGASGSGKSTLLNIIGLLLSPTRGSMQLLNESVVGLDDNALTHLRQKHIGFVFQFHHLLAGLTTLENLELPLRLETGVSPEEMRERAMAILRDVGLEHKANARPGEMSGGEQQRIAVARALIKNPPLILADEPTGNLDSENSKHLFDLMDRYNSERGTAFVVVTHDGSIAERCQRIIEVVDGRVRPAAA
jgi:lipoprotein-releasing system ATP-binding protein